MRALIIAILLAPLAAGCGQKGPLVLADARKGEVQKKKDAPPASAESTAPPVTPP
jgi:predicted small lipoprotein YifL